MGPGFCAQTGEGMFRAPSTTGEGASRSCSFGNRVNPQRGGPTSVGCVTARRSGLRSAVFWEPTGRYGFFVQETGRTRLGRWQRERSRPPLPGCREPRPYARDQVMEESHAPSALQKAGRRLRCFGAPDELTRGKRKGRLSRRPFCINVGTRLFGFATAPDQPIYAKAYRNKRKAGTSNRTGCAVIRRWRNRRMRRTR
jgi:hypothetical protein